MNSHDPGLQAETFLREYVGYGIHLVAIIPDGPTSGRYFGDDAAAAARWAISENAAGKGVYWTANIPRPGQHGKPPKGDIIAARFAHCDIDPSKDGGAFDKEAVLAELLAHNCPPTFVIDSGNGLQPLWRLDHAVSDQAAVEAINLGIREQFRGADACHNIDRLLRLPGTTNFPNAAKQRRGCEPVAALLVFGNNAIYSPAELAKAFPPPPQDKRAAGEAKAQADIGDIKLLTADDLGLSHLSSIRSLIDHPAGKDRSADGLRCAGDMLRAGFSREQIAGVLLNPANKVSAHYLDQQDPRRAVLRTIEYASRDRPTPGGKSTHHETAANDDIAPAFSDEALALSFAQTQARNLRYVALWGKWLTWDGSRWAPDEKMAAFSLARKHCRLAAVGCNKESAAKAIASGKTIAAVERLAKADPRLATVTDEWDTDPLLLNTPDGTIDLRNGSMRPHDPNDKLTKVTGAAPNRELPTPVWNNFLAEVTGGNDELVTYLQRMAGYSLTGLTREHALFFLYGLGANGKSTFLNVLTACLGDYHRMAPIETFTASTHERHPTDLAGLRGARLVTATETEEGRRWAESRIKSLTGGDPIPARFMRQDFFEYVPQFKLIIAGNHKPALRSVNEAIRRRFNLIPFTVTIPPEKRDPKLPERLRDELPGILAWMIAGCVAWQQRGLEPPRIVTEATAAYMADEDAIAAWIDDCCERNVNAWKSSTDLYASWSAWAQKAGEFAGSQKAFISGMEARGFNPARKGNARGFFGLRVLLTYEQGAA